MPLLADEQTLVTPGAAGGAFSAVPCARLAGTASPHLCLRAFALAAPIMLSIAPALHHCDKRDACPTFRFLYRELALMRRAECFGTGASPTLEL